jgi:hypothetical protein
MAHIIYKTVEGTIYKELGSNHNYFKLFPFGTIYDAYKTGSPRLWKITIRYIDPTQSMGNMISKFQFIFSKGKIFYIDTPDVDGDPEALILLIMAYNKSYINPEVFSAVPGQDSFKLVRPIYGQYDVTVDDLTIPKGQFTLDTMANAVVFATPCSGGEIVKILCTVNI